MFIYVEELILNVNSYKAVKERIKHTLSIFRFLSECHCLLASRLACRLSHVLRLYSHFHSHSTYLKIPNFSLPPHLHKGTYLSSVQLGRFLPQDKGEDNKCFLHWENVFKSHFYLKCFDALNLNLNFTLSQFFTFILGRMCSLIRLLTNIKIFVYELTQKLLIVN